MSFFTSNPCHRHTNIHKNKAMKLYQLHQNSNSTIFGPPFVKRFDLCYGSLSCLSVTLVYCGQTVGWMKMPLGTEIGLGPRDIVRWGSSSPHKNGRSSPPLFGPCLLWPDGHPSLKLLSLFKTTDCTTLQQTH